MIPSNYEFRNLHRLKSLLTNQQKYDYQQPLLRDPGRAAVLTMNVDFAVDIALPVTYEGKFNSTSNRFGRAPSPCN
jgi:hypothetical protein